MPAFPLTLELTSPEQARALAAQLLAVADAQDALDAAIAKLTRAGLAQEARIAPVSRQRGAEARREVKTTTGSREYGGEALRAAEGQNDPYPDVRIGRKDYPPTLSAEQLTQDAHFAVAVRKAAGSESIKRARQMWFVRGDDPRYLAFCKAPDPKLGPVIAKAVVVDGEWWLSVPGLDGKVRLGSF